MSSDNASVQEIKKYGCFCRFTECRVHRLHLRVEGVVCQLGHLVPHDGGNGEDERKDGRLHGGVLRGPEQPGLEEQEVDFPDVEQ